MGEVFRVVKIKPGQSIRAYKKFSGEIGAEMVKGDYIKAISEETDKAAYFAALVEKLGNPVAVFTKAKLLEKLLEADKALDKNHFFESLLSAADKVQDQMQKATVTVAALQPTPDN